MVEERGCLTPYPLLMSGLLSALIAAGVSAIVALLIEYAAKPGLEARKERILRERADLRELRRQLLLIIEREREGWASDLGGDDDDLIRLGVLADQAFEQLHRCSDLLPDEVRHLAEWGFDHYKSRFPVPG